MDYRFKFQFGDTDAAGIVYYPNYYRYMDNATHHFFEKLGYPTTDLMKQQRAIPLLEANCRFHSPGYFHREIVVITEVEYIHNKVFKLVHSFKDGENVIANGYEVRAWVSIEDQRPKALPIPEELKNKLQQYQIGG